MRLGSRQRRHGVLALLARLRWQPNPQAWTVPCRDEDGRRGHVRVSVGERGPQLTFNGAGKAVFDPLATGRLRGALREAIEIHARLANSDAQPEPRRHPGPAATPHSAESETRADATERVQVTLTSTVQDHEAHGRHVRHHTPKPTPPRLVDPTDTGEVPLREVA